jgi:hypothetical protein
MITPGPVAGVDSEFPHYTRFAMSLHPVGVLGEIVPPYSVHRSSVTGCSFVKRSYEVEFESYS